MNRLPSLPMVSIREVVYAQGTAGRVFCWLTVRHQPACRLVEDAYDDCKYLYIKLICQNLRSERVAISLSADSCLVLTHRDGSVSTPQVVSDACLVDAEEQCRRIPEELRSSCVLQPLQCAAADLRLQAGSKINFEPELLESCRLLRVGVLVSMPIAPQFVSLEGHAKEALAGIDGPREWQALHVPCRFAGEDLVWRHYQQVNRDFYVHLDRDSDLK